MPSTAPITKAFACLTFNTYGKVRREKMGGDDYYVVPVVLITTGTFRGNHGPFTYTENNLKRFPDGWNNKPVLLGHPATPGGAGRAAIMENQSLGILLNAKYEGGKLKAEAWLKESRLSLDSRLLPALTSGLPIPVSTGLFHDTVATTNAAGSEETEVCNIVPDHLAVLLDEPPACDIADGAGLCLNSLGPEPTSNALVASDLREQLVLALRKRFVGTENSSSLSLYVDDFYFDPAIVLFELGPILYKLGYSVTGNVVTLEDVAPERVIRQRQYRSETGVLLTKNSKGTSVMTKATLIAGILGAAGNRLTAEQLDTMDESILSNLAPVAGAPATAPATPPATENAAPKFDFNQMMAVAPPDVREMISDGIATNQQARHQMTTELTTNAACVFTQAELDAMPMANVRKLHASITAAGRVAAPAAPTVNSLAAQLRFGAVGQSAPAPAAPTTNAGTPPVLLAPSWDAK